MTQQEDNSDDDDVLARRLLGVPESAGDPHASARPAPPLLALDAMRRVAQLKRVLSPSDERELQVSWLSLEFAYHSKSAGYQRETLIRAAQSLCRVRDPDLRQLVLQQQLADAGRFDSAEPTEFSTLAVMYRRIFDDTMTYPPLAYGACEQTATDTALPVSSVAHSVSDSSSGSATFFGVTENDAAPVLEDTRQNVAGPDGRQEPPIVQREAAARSMPEVRRRFLVVGIAAGLLSVGVLLLVAPRLRGTLLTKQHRVTVVIDDDPWGSLIAPPAVVATLGPESERRLYIGDVIRTKLSHPAPLRHQWLLHIGRSVQLAACSSGRQEPVTYESRVENHPGDYEYLVIVTSDHPSPQFPLTCGESDDARLVLLTSEEMASLMVHPLSADRCRRIVSDALERNFDGHEVRVLVRQFRYQPQERPR